MGLALLLVAGCGDAREPMVVEPPRTATGVVGKPLVATPRGPAIADELVVQGRSGADLRAAVAAAGGELIWTGPRTGVGVARFADAGAALSGLSVLRRDPAVVWVDRSFVGSGAGISTSPGPVKLQWNLPALRLDPDQPWGSAAGTRVAVLDTGAAYEDHADAIATYALAPDLADVDFVQGIDLVHADDHANDDQGHGTHITAVIAATSGTAAMAADSAIVPVKVLDASNQGTELALAEGIYFAADASADIINMSLSFSPGFFPSPMLQAAVDYATEQGAVLVASAGNHGADLVSYPAAFREVIAVGASELGDGFKPALGNLWASTHAKLTATGYSNRGYALDLAAPAGRIDGDRDGDGNPEAIIAQSFSGDPTVFDYYFYAGTSQAAAQVSGLAAVMRAANPDLDARDMRSLLGETVRSSGDRPLDPTTGRGFARADLAARQADTARADRARPRFFAAVAAIIVVDGGQRYAEATVEITDEAGESAAGVEVYGTFTGNAVASVSGTTGADGTVRFRSPVLTDDAVLAGFQVDAVASAGTVDRPRGAIRIDSCSLELLSEFAVAAGISTSPGPITVRYDALPADAVPTVTLLNYTWSGAVAPMAVAVDESWYRNQFAGSEPLTVQVLGFGISTSPLVIDPATSFHPSATTAWTPTAGTDCTPLVVRTYASGPFDPGFAPVIADPAACGGDCDAVLLEMWQAFGLGIATSPLWQPDSGVDQTLFDHLSELMQVYVSFGSASAGCPIGSLGGVLDAAGIGLAPFGGVSSNSGTGMVPMN